MYTQTFTLTFGDCAENHVGMQKLGTLATQGFTYEDMVHAQEFFESKGIECDMHTLREYLPEDIDAEDAYLLVAKGGVRAFGINPDALYKEQDTLEKDTKALMYGRVVNKKARHNLCFGPDAQEPDYSAGKGRIVPFSSVPLLMTLRTSLPAMIGSKAEDLMVEGNYYYDITKTYIGFHGDAERRKVVGVRLGATFPFLFQWYQQGKAVGELLRLNLDHGDIYIMSEKCTGYDWKRRKIPTLRHAAGADKYLGL